MGLRLRWLVAVPLLLQGCVSLPGARPVAGAIEVQAMPAAPVTLPATLDDGRLFVTLSFRRPDGSLRPALAWVNMGMGGMSLAPALRNELGRGRPVTVLLGGVPVRIETEGVLASTAEEFAQQLGPMPVEAILPAGVLRQFRVTLDYAAPSVTLARPSAAPAPGVAVPVEVNEGTGLISAAAEVDGRRYAVVIDAGAGYSWWRGGIVREWVRAHPEWKRAEGAPGRSNQAMVDQPFEQEGTLVRVPDMRLGRLQLRDVGVLGSGPSSFGIAGRVIGHVFWGAWEKGAPGPVAGWLGGDALARYRLTIDAAHGMTWWESVSAAAPAEASVGLSFVHAPGGYRVGGIVHRAGTADVEGVEVGDQVISIDGKPATPMTRGMLMDALSGAPGGRHRLMLERDGRRVDVAVSVVGY